MDRIDKYKIVSTVNVSAAGSVYRAFDERLNRTVALKLYRTENRDHRDRLLARLDEIGTTLGSSHRNLVTAFDWGEENDAVYAVTDDSEARMLSDLIANPPGLEIVDKLFYLMQSAEALHYAHSRGITHGHLSPSHILVSPDRQIKITDLGIGSHLAKGGNSLTKIDPLIQTLAYQAPEQFEGVPSPLTDIFAFGVISFHLLTGEHPFQKSGNRNLGMLVQNILRGIPSPIKMDPASCPPSLEKLILRTIQKAPKDRYQSFEEIQTDLAPILTQCEFEWAETKTRECEFLFEQGKIEEAQDALLCVLRRVPVAAAAISLRTKIQQVTQTPEVREQREKLLQTGRQAFELQDYPQAIKDFEAVLALDSLAIEASMLKDEAIAIRARMERINCYLEEGLREAHEKHTLKAERMTDLFLNETIELLPHASMPHQSAIKIQKLIDAISEFGKG